MPRRHKRHFLRNRPFFGRIAVAAIQTGEICAFLSSEGLTLAGGFKTVGDLKAYFIERFKGVMFLTLKNADRTMSSVPPWAFERIRTAFNVQDLRNLSGQNRTSSFEGRSEAKHHR